jgi:pimeloyl-ACP methyl ester carboxylesterase
MRFVSYALGLALTLAWSACVAPAPMPDSPPKSADDGTQWVRVEGAWLRVLDAGKGDPTVVLVHGFGLSLKSWDPVTKALGKDHRVVAFDQRGFGLSERSAGEYGPQRHARDLVALLNALKIKDPLIVGHSYGAQVALQAANLLGERIRGLVLVDALVFDEQLTTTMRWSRVPALGEIIFGAFFAQRTDEEVLAAFSPNSDALSPTILSDYRTNNQRPGSSFAALQTVRGLTLASQEQGFVPAPVPTTLVWCREDAITPLIHGRALHTALNQSSPQTQLHVLNECGHMPQLEKPEDLVRIIRGHPPP